MADPNNYVFFQGVAGLEVVGGNLFLQSYPVFPFSFTTLRTLRACRGSTNPQ
jgi:hypothetical protein